MSKRLTLRPRLWGQKLQGLLPGRASGRRAGRIFGIGALTLATIFILYFAVLGSSMQSIDADPEFMPPNPVAGGSHAVNMAAALIEREVVTHRWAPNDPLFFPTAFHDNMANYQRGLMRAVSRFTLELESQIGRLRGSSAIDPDLGRAAGLLQFPTDVWLFDFEQSLLPVQPSDTQYRAASEALRAYNMRIANGQATFETRADALTLTIERMSSELGARAAVVDDHVRRDNFIMDGKSDDIYYYNKGMSYAAFMLLRELGRDFERVIETAGLRGVWEQALDSLKQAGTQRPLVVLNSDGVNSIFANHLHLQGFYMKRAMLQLEEVVRVTRVR